MAFLNTVLVIYLTILYFKTSLRNYTLSKLMCKVKTSILLMLVVYQLIVLYRYCLNYSSHESIYLIILTL